MKRSTKLETMVLRPMCRTSVAATRVPHKPGYYAIFVDDQYAFGKRFAPLIPQSKLVYIGVASRCLQNRLVCQDLRHESPASFFRSLGAVLKFRPRPGSLAGKKNTHNYRFTQAATDRIIGWIDEHLSVAWACKTPKPSIERSLIQRYRPIFNISHNPEPCPRIVELRRICRERARAA